jgi:RND family efflux transporter MFP subunit
MPIPMHRTQPNRRTAFALAAALLIPSAWAQNASPVAPARVTVDAQPLEKVWLLPQREAPADVVARNESKLSAEVSGSVLRWNADVGDSVKKGELLVQIDPRDYELAVQRARASLEAARSRLQLAQAQLQRSRELVAQGFFSQEALAQRETDVTLVQSDVTSAGAELATAQRQLAKTRLVAPFSGSVRARMAQTGEAVSPGTVLYELVEDGHNEVSATLIPADVAGLRSATAPQLHTREGQYPVRLLRVANTVTAPARTQAARLAFTDPANTPASGVSGTLRWQERQPHLPPQLMVRRNGSLGVFVVQGDGAQASAQFVTLTGAQESRATPVPQSLPGTIRVVVRGQEALQDGQAIEVRTTTP